MHNFQPIACASRSFREVLERSKFEKFAGFNSESGRDEV